jgi:hypothetical protein
MSAEVRSRPHFGRSEDGRRPPAAQPAYQGLFPVPKLAVDLVAVLVTVAAVDEGLSSFELIERLWQPQFPSSELVEAAAGLLPAARVSVLAGIAPRRPGEDSGRHAAGSLTEGPRWEIVISPGTVQVRTRDWAKVERSAERALERRQKGADAIAAWLATEDGLPDEPEPWQTITAWSRKSRANMCKRLHELDYGPLFDDPTRLPAMLTLTYPGDWLTVAPTGRAVKRHLDQLRKRYKRAWGEDLRALWKLEFQRRGAPHFHLLMVPPHGETKHGESFRPWVSRVWAHIVSHPDPEEYAKHARAGTGVDYAEGLRAKDPRRVAIYFLKHGVQRSKEYQHVVPEEWQRPGCGPGRFWGYWKLAPVRGARHVDVEVGIAAGRVLRRWAKAQRVYQRRQVMRIEQSTGRVYYRTSRFRVARLANGRGWVSVNDGPAFASQLSRYLSTVV